MSEQKTVFSGASIGDDPKFMQMLMGFRGDYFAENDFPELIAFIDGRDRMTLRDHFAAKCMAAMLGNTDKDGVNRGASGVATFAAYAYEYADAMIAERAK